MNSHAPALTAPALTAAADGASITATDSDADPYVQIVRSGVVLFVSMMAVLVAIAFIGATP